jgi:PAS domain S-box-containing protein
MGSSAIDRLRFGLWVWPAAAGALALVTLCGLWLSFSTGTASFAFLALVVLTALFARPVTAVAVALLAAACLNYFFVAPRFTLAIHSKDDILMVAAFVLTSVVVSVLVRRAGRLAESERDLSQLLHLSHDPVFVRDSDDLITFWNRGAEEVYGWSAGEAVGKRVHDLLKTQFATPLEEIRSAIDTAGRWQGELVRSRRDGSSVIVQSRWSAQRNSKGETVAILEANDDITERSKAEQLLQASQSVYLTAAQRLTQTGSIAWNTATGELEWSEETFRICGIEPRDKLSIAVIQQMLHPEDTAAYQAAVQTAVATRSRFDHVVRIIRPDSEVRFLHMVGEFLEQKPEQFVGALTDITQRRKDEEALRTSEFHYRNMFDALAASFWELDFSGVTPILRALKKQGVKDFAAHFKAHPEVLRDMMRETRVIDVNDQTVRLFGRGDKAELLTSVEPFWPEVSADVYARSIIASISGVPGLSEETRLRRIDGTEFEAVFTVSFLPQGVASSRFLIAVIDISERVSAQDALRRLQAEFAHAARLATLGELAASIAHEVNQPLAAITTNASASLRWLDRPEPNVEEVRTLAARISADARRAADVIARVRSMATRREGERAPLAIAPVIEEAAAFLRHDMLGHRVSMTLHLERDLPQVMGDRVQVQQVVVNLAMNAVQAMSSAHGPRRSISIAAHREGERVVVTVDDDGPGIPDEHFPRLFESFFTTKDSGMGIGLPICKTIVEAHGGDIRAENRPGGGARFAFSLPAQLPDEAAHTSV